MKKIVALFFATVITVHSTFPCTTFVLKTKNGLYFGRNLDWVSDMGLVIVNQRNTSKTSFVFPPERSISWTSKYGSISFNQFGKEFPFGGINEKGLVVEVMVSPTDYPEADERPIVNELQWVQYQLDNCATIDEVLATDKVIRIGQAHEGLHYLICDAEGNVAVVEFIGGKMVSYKGDKLVAPVLENETYETSREGYQNKEACRFTTAADMVKEYKGANGVEYSFEILKEVALSAEWSVVYDIHKKQIHFRTNSIEDIRIVDLNSFDFGCASDNLSYDMSKVSIGNITDKFIKLNVGTNTEFLKKAMMANVVVMEKEQYGMLVDYFKECKCENE
jgi:hypothetical protein